MWWLRWFSIYATLSTAGLCQIYFIDSDSDQSRCIFKLVCTESTNFISTTNWKRKCRSGQSRYYNYYGSYYNNNVKLPKIIAKLENIDESFIWHESVEEYVTSLDGSSNVWTNIPSAVFDMKSVQIINLTSCQIQNAALAKMHNLTKLSQINLSYNLIDSFGDDIRGADETVLRVLNLEHNLIENIPDEYLSSFSKLTDIDLSHNNLKMVRNLSFYGLSELSIIRMSYNVINDIGCALGTLTELTEIYLDHNQIKSIQPTNFDALQKLKTLHLENNMITELDPKTFGGLVSLKHLDLSYNQIIAISRLLLEHNKYIQVVNFSYNKIYKLDKDVFKNTHNISYFNIEGNQLERAIQKGMFNDLSEISHFNLSYHKFNSIENLAFMGASNILVLNISHNILSTISNYSFTSLRQLSHLDLSSNYINNIDFDKSDLGNVRSLFLGNNNISVLSNTTFEDLKGLEILDLSSNKISDLDHNFFITLLKLNDLFINMNTLKCELGAKSLNGLLSLRKLELQQTGITILRNNSFDNVTSLVALNVSHSNITEIEYNAFSSACPLLELDLSYNLLTKFDINGTNINKLEILNLNNNFLISLNSQVYSHLTTLKRFIVSRNNIKTTKGVNFINNSKLEHVDLSYNKDLHSDGELFNNMPSLTTLELTGVQHFNFKALQNTKLTELILNSAQINNISALYLANVNKFQILRLNTNYVRVITKSAFHSLKDLKYLDLSKNVLELIEPASFIDVAMLVNLNMSNNKISSLSFGIFKGLTQLRSLDLSGNLIKTLNGYRLYDTPNLTFLAVDNNMITNIVVTDFKDTHVEHLSIGGNLLSCNVLVSLKRAFSERRFILTAAFLNFHTENVDGISCRESEEIKENEWLKWNSTSFQSIVDNMATLGQNINDIKNNINSTNNVRSDKFYSSTQPFEELQKIQEILMKNMTDVNSEFAKNFTERNFQFMNKVIDVFKNVSLYSQSNNYNDVALGNHTFNNFTYIKPVNVGDNESGLVDDEKLSSHQVRQLIDEERKSIVQEVRDIVNGKLEDVKKSMKESSKYVNDLQSNVHDKNGVNNNVFLEACVGILLVVIVCYIVFQIYNSNMNARKRGLRNQEYATIEMHD